MRVLYVVGSCLTKNTSANMSHNCFVQGLIENGCEVEIIMANDSWGQADQGLSRWDQAKYHVYNNVSVAEKIRRRFSGVGTNVVSSGNKENKTSAITKETWKQKLRTILKKVFYKMFPVDPVYPLEKEWLKNACEFRSAVCYDLVISNSSPAASHRLVSELIDKKRIQFKRWIQIWEDPWYFDLYGGHTEAIKEEEHYLLSRASEIYYVSPLTLMYQKKHYPDCAEKMKVVPLPAMEYEKEHQKKSSDTISLGYFGDYYSVTRNLKPFYDAICKSGCKGYIYGDTDLQLQQKEHVVVKGRVTLDELSKIQEKTDVLVHLCNLHGGQIPGKIYHYSVTNKPILFILDGTEEEKQAICEFFGQFRRYYFCENNVQDIQLTINEIKEQIKEKTWEQVEEFKPRQVIKKILVNR